MDGDYDYDNKGRPALSYVLMGRKRARGSSILIFTGGSADLNNRNLEAQGGNPAFPYVLMGFKRASGPSVSFKNREVSLVNESKGSSSQAWRVRHFNTDFVVCPLL